MTTPKRPLSNDGPSDNKRTSGGEAVAMVQPGTGPLSQLASRSPPIPFTASYDLRDFALNEEEGLPERALDLSPPAASRPPQTSSSGTISRHSFLPPSAASNSSSAQPSSTPSKPRSSATSSARKRDFEEKELTKEWFGSGEVLQVELHDLLVALGTSPAECEEREKRADQLPTFEQKVALQKSFSTEGGREQQREGGWVAELAAVARPSPSSSALHFISAPTTALRSRSFSHARKPDAGLCASTAPVTNFDDFVVLFEWTNTEEPLKRAGTIGKKLAQLVFNLPDLLASQIGRLYVPGLAICGTTAHFALLDRECLRVAVVADCWGQGFGQLAAGVSVLMDLDLVSAGFLPIFNYWCSLSGIAPSSIATNPFPTSSRFDPSLAHTLEVIASPFPQHTPFSRGTTTLRVVWPAAADPSTEMVIKIQHVADSRLRREPRILRSITDANLDKTDASHLVQLSECTAFRPLRHQSPSLPTGLIPRHVEILLLSNPFTGAVRLDDRRHPPTLLELVSVLGQLSALLFALSNKAGVLHRDIAPGNVLRSGTHLVLIDFDCASKLGDTSLGGVRAGTLETMSRAALTGKDATLLDDLESIIYLFF